MEAKKAVDELLEECGATLVRDRKHEVWQLPNGQKFTRAKTPSDIRAGWNELSDLRRALGIVNQGSGPGERRERRLSRKKEKAAAWHHRPTFNSTLADQLRVTGITEESLRLEIASLKTQLESCWLCRLRRWWANREN